MSRYQDDNREIEIQMVMNLIQAMCEKNNISIIPYEYHNHGIIVAVQDTETGKVYGLQTDKEV